MKKIPLSQGKFAIVDDADFEWLNQWKWCLTHHKYAVRNSLEVDGKRSLIYIHRQIMSPEDGLSVDHINGDTLNNSRSNLRECFHHENLVNQRRKKTPASGHRGVYPMRNKWQVKFNFNSKTYRFGVFFHKEDAVRMAKEKIKLIHGEFSSI